MRVSELRAILAGFTGDTEIQINISDDNMTVSSDVISLDEEYDDEVCVLSVVLPDSTYLEEDAGSCLKGGCFDIETT